MEQELDVELQLVDEFLQLAIGNLLVELSQVVALAVVVLVEVLELLKAVSDVVGCSQALSLFFYFSPQLVLLWNRCCLYRLHRAHWIRGLCLLILL